MSYILGFYSKSHNIDKLNINAVIEDFSNNAIGNFESYSDKIVFLSSIVSPDPGISNISENEDRSRIIFLAGELYEIESDEIQKLKKKGHKIKNEKNASEIILHMYEEYGDINYKNLNGSFTFAIYDKQTCDLVLGNDSFGSYPLFMYDHDDILIFSTEYEPITKFKNFDSALDYDSIAEYFTMGQTLGDKTFFKYIKNLSPGSTVKLSNSSVLVNKYDKLEIKINNKKNLDYFAEELSNLIYKATQQRLKGRNQLKCSLTGGTDSRLILGNLTPLQIKKIEFITNDNPWVKNEYNRDVVISKMLATKYNLRHSVISKSSLVYSDFGVSYLKRRRIKNTVGRNRLMGWGGGEFVGGACLNSQLDIINKDKNTVNEILNSFFDRDFVNTISHPIQNLQKEINNISAENIEFLFSIFLYTRPFFSSRWGGSRGGWLQPYKFILNGIPIFWDDNNIFKFLLTIPKSYLKNRKLYRSLYYNHYSELLEIPTTRQDMNPIKLPTIPSESIKLKYTRALRAYLNSRHTYDKKFYNSEYLLKISKDIKNELIIRFIDFEAWYRLYAL